MPFIRDKSKNLESLWRVSTWEVPVGCSEPEASLSSRPLIYGTHKSHGHNNTHNGGPSDEFDNAQASLPNSRKFQHEPFVPLNYYIN